MYSTLFLHRPIVPLSPKSLKKTFTGRQLVCQPQLISYSAFKGRVLQVSWQYGSVPGRYSIDAGSFVIAGILILTLPGSLMRKATATDAKTKTLSAWQDVLKGARLLFGNKLIRFALSIEFVSAIAGAQILVNTVGHIKSGLYLNGQHYGWMMAAFGIGAAIATFVSGAIDKSKSRKTSLLIGALMLGLAITGANYVSYSVMLLL